MIIVDLVEMDIQGRISLKNIRDHLLSKAVRIVIDYEKKMIAIKDESELDYGTRHLIDEKKRVAIPKWLRAEIEGKPLLVMIEEEENKTNVWLSPKTDNIL